MPLLENYIWSRFDGTEYIVEVNTVTDGISEIVYLGKGTGCKIANNRKGDSIAVWLEPYIPGEVNKNISYDLVNNTQDKQVKDWPGYNAILASTKSFGGNWTTPVNISDYIGTNGDPYITIDEKGNIIIIWTYISDPTSPYISIKSITKSVGGNWTKSTTIDTGSQINKNLAIDNLGNAIVTLTFYTDGVIKYYTKSVNGNWTTAVTIVDDPGIINSYLAVDPLGNAIVTFYYLDGIIKSITKKVGSNWTSPVNISNQIGYIIYGKLVIDSLGNAVFIWVYNDINDGTFVVKGSTKSLNGEWITPVSISDISPSMMSINLVIDSSGDAIAVWDFSLYSPKSVLSENTKSSPIFVLQTSKMSNTKGFNNVWSIPKNIAEKILADGIASIIAIDNSGDIIVTFGGLNFDNYYVTSIQSIIRDVNGNWSEPISVSENGNYYPVFGVLLNTYVEPTTTTTTTTKPTTTTTTTTKPTTTTTTTEPICLVAGTPVTTDQGVIAIEKIDTNEHTIGNKRILAITKTITPEENLVCFEANSMGINIPSQRTIMTPGHEVLYRGKLVQAKHFVGRLVGVYSIPYNGKDVLYNVLQEVHGLMKVNNMVLETLHPANKVAKEIITSLTLLHRSK